MDRQDLKYPLWQDPLLDALTEIRPSQFREKLEKAEAVIGERVRALALTNDNHDERRAIIDAVCTLCLSK